MRGELVEPLSDILRAQWAVDQEQTILGVYGSKMDAKQIVFHENPGGEDAHAVGLSARVRESIITGG